MKTLSTRKNWMKPAKVARRKSKAAIKREREATIQERASACDHCGEPFPVTRIRSEGSAVCAAGDGTFVDWGDAIRYFCSKECMESFKEPVA